jgi:Carboxypeptidase regulatory-like domain
MKPVVLVLAVLLSAGCGSGGAGDDTTGIRGVVLAGPQCPVVTVASPCPDLPIEATVVAMNADGDVVARTDSDARGRFRMPLPAGIYTLTAEGLTGIQFAKPTPVSVPSGRFVTVTISVDTGIR